MWNELYRAERARILRLLIERIDVAPDGDPQTLTEFAPRLLFRDLTMAMLLTPPINELRPE